MTETGCGVRFKKFWREGHQQAQIDIRDRWHRAVAALWFVGLCACFGILSPISRLGGQAGSACTPDGSFSLNPEQFRFWSRSGFFQITLGFGSLSFEQAKAIDVIWDIGFGRGGQTLLAFISWVVFSKYLTTSMEVMPVTFHTYRTVFLKDQPPILAIPTMIRDFTIRLGLHSKFAMTFMIITMIFVWAFPTLGSAMTGYDSNVQAFINDAGNFIPFNSFRRHFFTIHDAERIGLTSPYNIASNQTNGDDLLYGRELVEALYHAGFILNVRNYVKRYYVDKHENLTNTIFGNITLQPPRLNISTYYLMDGLGWGDAFNDISRTHWLLSDKTFDRDYIKRNGRCQPLSTYRWGFSFVQVNLMVIFLLIWTIGICAMWISANIAMEKRGRHHVAGENKAVLELAVAMQNQLRQVDGEDTKEIHTLAESVLAHQISKDLRGGSIAYEAPLSPNGEDGVGDSGWGLKSYLWKEKWWLLAIIIFSAGSIISGVYEALPLTFFVVGFALQCILTLDIGTTPRSRAILWWWFFWGLVVLPQIIAVIGLWFTNEPRRLIYR